jgi:hypothetical protein
VSARGRSEEEGREVARPLKPVRPDSNQSPPEGTADALFLQRTVGNAAAARLLESASGLPVQSDLVLGQRGDRYEREAERVADEVVRGDGTGSADTVRDDSTEAKTRADGEGTVWRNAGRPAGGGVPAPPSVERALDSPGSPLQDRPKAEMENRFGTSFSDVRVHVGPKAETATREIAANAFTVGRDIVFAPGLYSPSTNDGRRLLAHELTHVVQQTGSSATGAQRRPVQASPNIVQREGDEPAQGTVTVITGEAEPVVAAEPDAAARAIYMQLNDPGLAKERAELGSAVEKALDIGRFAKKVLTTTISDDDSVGVVNFQLGMKQLSALDTAFKMKSLVAAKKLQTATGITDLLKGGLTLTEGAVSSITQVVYVAMKLTRNPEYIAQAGKMVLDVKKGLGYFGALTSFVSALHGLAMIVEGESDKKLEGAVGVTTGALGVAGAILKPKVFSTGILSFAIEVEYEKWKLVAKHIYGESLTAFTATAVNPHYERLGADLRTLAAAAFDLQHWTDVRNEAILGNTPEDEIKIGQAEEGIRKSLPGVQRALRVLNEDAQRMPTRMRETFIANKDLLEAWRLGTQDPGLDLIVVPDAALRAAEGTFAVGEQLVKDYELVLKETAMERADQFHGR